MRNRGQYREGMTKRRTDGAAILVRGPWHTQRKISGGEV